MKVFGSPFAINWNDRSAVIEYAKRLGPGMSVVKHPDRANYNVTHTSRTDLYKPEWVAFQT